MSPREGPEPAGQVDQDQPLVERARRGETEAFGALVRAHQHRIVNFIRAMVSDQADAEDLAQETFLRAYRGLRTFRGDSSFKTWLYQIAANASRTHLARRRDRPERAAGDAAATPEAFGDPRTGEDIEAAVVHRDAIDRALSGLPHELREAVVLRDVEGLDYREIAGALGVPIGTVESRIFRGRARLRAALKTAGD